jgi:autoinducer 2-degrading protein
VRANAATSVAMEPGCQRFDVLVPRNAAPGDIVLYEIYDDRGAFEAHLASEHFASFDRQTKAIVTNKVIVEFEAIENAKPRS